MHAGSCQEDTSPNRSMHTITSKNGATGNHLVTCVLSHNYELRDISQNGDAWNHKSEINQCNYLYFFIAAEKTTTTKNNSKNKSELWMYTWNSKWGKNLKCGLYTQNSKKKIRIPKKTWELWMLLKFQGEKIIPRTKSELWMYTWNSKWGKKFRNVDCTLSIQEKTCENCGCKVEIPRRKNYSKKKVRIVRWQESNWIARRKSE